VEGTGQGGRERHQESPRQSARPSQGQANRTLAPARPNRLTPDRWSVPPHAVIVRRV